MHQCSHRVLSDGREVRWNFKGEFDGLQAFEHIHDSLPAVDGFDRIILDFSSVTRVKPIELHYLMADLADDPCFNNIEIRVEGLRYSYMDMECPHERREGRAIKHHAMSLE